MDANATWFDAEATADLIDLARDATALFEQYEPVGHAAEPRAAPEDTCENLYALPL
jgi:hypothetical protein